jgi:hypothetical protein
MAFISALLGLSAVAGRAHVTLVSPEGGETLSGGSTFTVAWDADDHDCVYHLYYSPDSGAHWTVVALDIPRDTRTYKWQVPDSAGEKGMIRILQDNKTGTDLDDKSGAFRITGGSGIRAFQDPSRKLEMVFTADRTLVSLSLDAPVEAVIEVFDARGALAATWLRGRLPAGAHRLAFPASIRPASAALARIRLGGSERSFLIPRAD